MMELFQNFFTSAGIEAPTNRARKHMDGFGMFVRRGQRWPV